MHHILVHWYPVNERITSSLASDLCNLTKSSRILSNVMSGKPWADYNGLSCAVGCSEGGEPCQVVFG